MVEFSKIMQQKSNGGGKIVKRSGTKKVGLNRHQLSSRRHGDTPANGEIDTAGNRSVIENRKELYSKLTDYLVLIISAVRDDKPFSLEPGVGVLEKIVEIKTPIDALFLKAIHADESYDMLINHSVNVAIYAIKMADCLGFSKTRQVEIGMVGLLHDVGMARIPDDLIYKQNLTEEDFSIFKQRPSYGYDILADFKGEHAYLPECTLQIHERIDGSGYPRGLREDEIHEYAQIIGLVDIYEALIHSRPQREKILHFYAVKEIIKTGKHKFQQKFMKALLNTFSIFPIHSYVRLNSGAIGKVIWTYNDQPMRPKLQIVYDSQDKRVLTERIINLPDHSLLYIIDSVSEQELVEISEASYLVTRPGRGAGALEDTGSDTEKPEAESKVGESVETTTPDESPSSLNSDPFLKKDLPALKKKRPVFKKGVLAVACLLLIAGIVWQFTGGITGNEKDQIASHPEEKAVTAQKETPAVKPAGKKTAEAEASRARTSAADKAAQNITGAAAEETVKATGRSGAAASDQTIRAAAERPVKSEAPEFGERLPEAIGEPEPGRYPYSILLASYKNLKSAEKALAHFKDIGLDSFWVKVDLGKNGTWFRLFSGKFADRKQAMAEIENRQLEGALAKPTRYAAWLGGFRDRQKLAEEFNMLAGLGFSTYAISGNENIQHLYVGAFYTEKGAQDQVANLKDAGVKSKVVRR